MSEEKFTPGEWFIGNAFNYEGANDYVKVFADGEREPIAEVLVKNRSFGKEYHNANLIATAPKMYAKLKTVLLLCESNLLRKTRCDVLGKEISELLKKARGEE